MLNLLINKNIVLVIASLLSHAAFASLIPMQNFGEFHTQALSLADSKDDNVSSELSDACKVYKEHIRNTNLFSAALKKMGGLGAFILYAQSTNLLFLGKLDRNLGFAALATAGSLYAVDKYKEHKNQEKIIKNNFISGSKTLTTELVKEITQNLTPDSYKNVKKGIFVGIWGVYGASFLFNKGFLNKVYNFYNHTSFTSLFTKENILKGATVGFVGYVTARKVYSVFSTPGKKVSFKEPSDNTTLLGDNLNAGKPAPVSPEGENLLQQIEEDTAFKPNNPAGEDKISSTGFGHNNLEDKQDHSDEDLPEWNTEYDPKFDHTELSLELDQPSLSPRAAALEKQSPVEQSRPVQHHAQPASLSPKVESRPTSPLTPIKKNPSTPFSTPTNTPPEEGNSEQTPSNTDTLSSAVQADNSTQPNDLQASIISFADSSKEEQPSPSTSITDSDGAREDAAVVDSVIPGICRDENGLVLI